MKLLHIFKYIKYKKKNHYMSIITKSIINHINIYVLKKEYSLKNEHLHEIKTLYNSHIIYRIVIENYLKCNKCNYIFNTDDLRDIYLCFICDKLICSYCTNKCLPCIPYSHEVFYHCIECKYKTFNYIKEKLNKIDFNNKEEMQQIKYIIYRIYKDYIKESENINYFKINNDMKKMLTLQYYINMNY